MHWFIKTIGLELAEFLLDKLRLTIIEVYHDQIITRAESDLNDFQKRRSALIQSISKADNNETRRTLSIMLSELK